MKNKPQSYRDLLIWQKGIELAKEVHEIVIKFPKESRYGLASHLYRAVISVPSNIAEGQSRYHTNEFRQFLYIALGSLAEVDTQIVLATEFGYCLREEAENINRRIIELRKMIYGLISSLPK